MTLIRKYSPNTKWGKQHVEVVLMQWDYSTTYKVDIGGNCTGFGVLEAAVDRIYDSLMEIEDEVPTLILKKKGGKTLRCTADDDERQEDWIKDMVVSVRIVGWTPPTLNEVRKMNGAKPVKDGNQPWQPN